MALVTFARAAAPVASFSPTSNPVFGGYTRNRQYLSGYDLTDGGEPYSYSHGDLNLMVLRWAKMKAADLTNLLAFVGAISGGRYTFTFTDKDGTSFANSRITNGDAIDWMDVGSGRYEVVLELEVA